jgi:hypothetical protein
MEFQVLNLFFESISLIFFEMKMYEDVDLFDPSNRRL